MDIQEYEREHIELMRKLAPECCVLLKSNGDFPLDDTCSLALVGNGARRTIKGGSGSGDVNSRYYTTCEAALDKAGFQLTNSEWLDGYDKVYEEASAAFVKKMKAEAREHHMLAATYAMGAVMPEPECEIRITVNADACVYVLARDSGEGNDRSPSKGQMMLTDSEIRDILFCQKYFRKFMLVLNVGAPIDLSPVDEVENILILSQLGVVTGDVLADILLGRAYPSGKLSSTWSDWEDYSKEGDFGQLNDTRYKEGIYVGYRYFDSVGKKARYPFGFGLSYTTFDVEPVKVDTKESTVNVTAKVTNTGKLIGKEVVQLYVTAPWGKLDKPYQTLVGFLKTKSLMPGEHEEVTISFDMVDVASFDEFKDAYVLENGNYILRIGNSSVNTSVAGLVKLDETIIVKKLNSILHEPDFTDFVPKNTWSDEDLSAFEPIVLDPYVFAGIEQGKTARPSDEAMEIVTKLSDEELCMLLIGDHPKKDGFANVIGSAAKHVAGAAGETYDGVAGVEPIIMADGPAGIRVNNTYYKKDGKVHAVGNTMPASVVPYLPSAFSLFTNKKAPKNAEIKYHYATAIPIGTAIAQSFNVELAKACGDIVGDEMERMGIDLWLAPALNIHRSPLCGRNFEYYSEDPLVSGLMAAFITMGVQSHEGKGVTIKHLCCNNQETNRFQNNSILSQRAIREIYLKGFEICIRMADPMAIMTSYNLVNGVHTSENEDILKKVVRNEWGYSGLIMTDWVVTGMHNKAGKYGVAKPSDSVLATNDLFMPGSVANYEQLLAAMKDNGKNKKVKREDLIYCAAHVVDAVLKCKKGKKA